MKKLNSTNEVVRILEEEGILVPEDFSRNLKKNANRFGESYVPSSEQVYAITKACNYWKSYVKNETEFSKLVVNSIFSMARVGAVVIRSNRILEDNTCIADICKVKNEKELPECTIIVVSRMGECKIQRGFATPLVEF